jgi:hypothetical protein
MLAILGFLFLIGLVKTINHRTFQKIFEAGALKDKAEAAKKDAREEAALVNGCGCGFESTEAENQDDMASGLAIWTPDTRRRFVNRCVELMKQGVPQEESVSRYLTYRIAVLKSIKIDYALYAPLKRQMEKEHWTATEFHRRKEDLMNKWRKSPAFAKYMEEATAEANEHNERIMVK